MSQGQGQAEKQKNTISVSSKPPRIQLPPEERHKLDTQDFQGKIHHPASIGIPKKLGKCALLFSKNQAESREGT